MIDLLVGLHQLGMRPFIEVDQRVAIIKQHRLERPAHTRDRKVVRFSGPSSISSPGVSRTKAQCATGSPLRSPPKPATPPVPSPTGPWRAAFPRWLTVVSLEGRAFIRC